LAISCVAAPGLELPVLVGIQAGQECDAARTAGRLRDVGPGKTGAAGPVSPAQETHSGSRALASNTISNLQDMSY
jgi:hypothetical protein